ncbi:MAG TPA: PDGLE domain-containing protein [Nocardioidaceae bacterium]|nr:PDGLE domain-containing protein [Nocardioidaceae bacterium]
MRTRSFVLVGVLVALLLAGVVSFYASSSPDGLERVAEDHGFAKTAGEHDTGDSPLADYSTKGVDDARLSGGLAGVTGAVVVLLLAGGLAWTVRRRGAPSRDDDNQDSQSGAEKS